MANTYVKIATVTAPAGGAADITFLSIPSTYTDLALKMSLRDSAASTRSIARVTFNGSATSYSSRAVYGLDSSSTGSASGGSTYIDFNYAVGNNATASTFSNNEMYVPNYAGSSNKSVSIDFTAENNSSTSWIDGLVAGLWSNSAAINQITLTAGTANFLQYSTATLYGISKS
jgi:hypothetical protein